MVDTYTVERTQYIAAPPDAVREHLIDLHRWQEWSPWEGVDPELKRMYGGAEAGVGAWYEWDGNRKAGKGRMEVIDVDDSTIRIDLQFVKPFRSHSNTTFDLQPDGDGEGTLVTWTLVGPNTGVTKVMGLFTSMDKMVGPDFERGLARLKGVAEAGGS